MAKIYHSDADLIGGYLAYAANPDQDLNFWAFHALNDLLADDSERFWRMTQELIFCTQDEQILHTIATGPLADILAYHGPKFIKRIEKQARKDRHFRLALANVGGQNRFSPKVYERVQQVLSSIQ